VAKQLAKTVAKHAEEARVAIRNIRRGRTTSSRRWRADKRSPRTRSAVVTTDPADTTKYIAKVDELLKKRSRNFVLLARV